VARHAPRTTHHKKDNPDAKYTETFFAAPSNPSS
jgi:hypothetical protein